MKSIMAWLKASRLQSQSYIFLPILFGQAYYVFQGHKLNWTILVVMILFGLFDQLYIVFSNDFADIETDCKNTTFTIFSGGSRVLVDGDLVPKKNKKASLNMAGLCILCGIILTLVYQRMLALPIIIIALGLLWMYNYPPVKLSYRGGGEILQMLGVGLLLPFFGYYAQSGELNGFPLTLLFVILPTQLACAMATSLSDEPSDRLCGKHTLTVLLESKVTKYSIIGLNIISIVVFPFVSWLPPGDIQIYMILLIPVLASVSQFFFINSNPGSLKLTIFIFLAVLITLSFMGGMAISLFC
ncbi:MAG: prenyltransferase [Deltaproteobacteria bacterium]|nr:prenyltransferase [Deltaproteobacteria bacterium]